MNTDVSPDTMTPVEDGERRGRLTSQLARNVANFREITIIVLLLVLIVAVGLESPRFLSGANIRSVFLAISILLVLAVGELVVMLGRNFDLSIGSTVGLSAMAVGMIFKNHPGMSSILAFAIAMAIGMAVGFLNGILIAYLRIPSIILTLGMLSVVSGFIYIVANGDQVDPTYVPSRFVAISITSAVGIPGIVIIAFVFAAAVSVALRWTRLGRSIFALGSSPDAAVLQGLPIRRLVIASFVVSGAAAGLAGAIYLSEFVLVNVTAGAGLELQAITAVVVGGASIFGGAGSVLGTTISCIMLGAMTNAFAVLGLSTFWQDTAYGALLLLAVIVNAMTRRLQDSRALVRPELTL
jgi:rhamnose transport system permease protein